jgi:hypothetical protein
MAGTTGLEPATSAVTGQRSNQLSYVPKILSTTCQTFALIFRLFGHQTIQRNHKIKSTRFGVRVPSDKNKKMGLAHESYRTGGGRLGLA